jgi:hypothetical protein
MDIDAEMAVLVGLTGELTILRLCSFRERPVNASRNSFNCSQTAEIRVPGALISGCALLVEAGGIKGAG